MTKITKTILWIVVVIVVIGLIWWTMTQKPTKGEGIKIGAVLSLTGELAKYGEGIKNGINMAIEELRIQERTKIIIEDDLSCNIKEAVTSAQKLININKVDFIVGPMCSAAAVAVAPIAEEAKTVMISPSASSPTLSESGDYIFRTYPSDKLKSTETVKFVATTLGFLKIALLIDIANDSFVQQREDIKDIAQEFSTEIVTEESFRTKDTDFKTQLMKIKNSEAEVIIFAAFAKETGLFLKQAKELDINIPFVSSDVMVEDPDVIEIAGDAAEGIIYAYLVEPTNPEHESFIERYKNKFGQEPPAFAAEAYDATILVIKAVNSSDGSKGDIKDQLYKVGQNYVGASGIINFDKKGDVVKPVLFKTVKNGQFVPYEE